MGWLYMQSLDGYSGPRQYLDAQFTCQRGDVTMKVLRSALVRMRTYYAALEYARATTGEHSVVGIVCLVRYNPRDSEGYIFGYKDMEESMGPCEAECPESILDLLTPTDKPYAIEWRARCRENAAARRAITRKPSPRPGQTIILEQPLLFGDGRTLDRFEVIANPRSHRTVLYRSPKTGGLYRITNVKRRAYRLIDPI